MRFFIPPHFISHTFLRFLGMYFYLLLLTFLRFECHVFYGFTICLLKNPSILYWAIFFDLTTAFFDN